MDHILSTFMVHLRKRRQVDEIFDFASLIVVPELTVSLIMDDMKVDDAKARRIWVQSAAIGDILNGIT
jgi:geranylgeranyl pyrophosphate synthase